MELLPASLQQWNTVFVIVNAVVGFFMCFMGCRFWATLLGINGFIGGFGGGAVLTVIISAANGQRGGPDVMVMAFAFGILGGVIMAAIMGGLPRFGTFLTSWGVYGGLCFMGCSAFFQSQGHLTEENVARAVFLCVVVGLIGAVVTLAAGRGGIVVVSSIGGAVALAVGAVEFLSSQRTGLMDTWGPWLTLIGILAGLGMLIQFASLGSEKAPASSPAQAQTAPPSAPRVRVRQAAIPYPEENPDVPTAQPATPAVAALQANPPAPEEDDVESKLRTLKAWHETGLIGPEEYESKRKELLDRLI